MKRKKYKTGSKQGMVSEPVVLYSKKENEIRFFNSFEEMNEHDIIEMAKSTPQKRFENITYVIMQRYAEELRRPLKDFSIRFGKKG